MGKSTSNEMKAEFPMEFDLDDDISYLMSVEQLLEASGPTGLANRISIFLVSFPFVPLDKSIVRTFGYL